MTLEAASLTRLPFDDLAAFSDLFRQYTRDYDALADYFAGDYRAPDALAQAATRAAAFGRDRAALVDVLTDQNARWGLDAATRANLDALRDPEAVAVVTGQQVGLLTGPLYTPYKTITALQLAQRLREVTGRPVVPVFWLEGEDHDLEEVAATRILRGNDPLSLAYTGHVLPEDGTNLGPVGALPFTEQLNAVLEALAEALPPTDFKPDVMAAVRAAYQPGHTFRDAFALLMRAFFPDQGLVFISPDDARLKRLAAPLFAREIDGHAEASRRLEAVSKRLVADGFHAQVQTRPTNLFLLTESGRYPLDAQTDETFEVRGTGQRYSRADLHALLQTAPERFSPNVVLRPLVQDLLLPTAAYIAGPGEVAYFAQYKPLYAWAEQPMPIIYPRASVTLVEGKVKKVMDRYGAALPAFEAEPEKLFRQVVLDQMAFDVEAVFRTAGQPLHQAINGLKPMLQEVDQSLIKAAEATRAALMKEMDRLKGRVIKAEKRNHDTVAAQLEKAQVNLFPAGKPQERALSALYFLNKYSLHLLRELEDRLDLDTTAHQVLWL